MSKTMRILALCVAVLMVATCFVGCKKDGEEQAGGNTTTTTTTVNGGANNNGTPSSSDNSSTSDIISSTTTTIDQDNMPSNSVSVPTGPVTTLPVVDNSNITRSGFPIAKNKVTLRVAIHKPATHTVDYDKLLFTTDYEKKTNVHIQWEPYATSDEVYRLNTILTSGDYPDVMMFERGWNTVGSAAVEKSVADGIFLSLSDAELATWAPNVYAAINKVAGCRQKITLSDGKIYSIPRAGIGASHENYLNKMYINQAWLDALDLDMPTTYAELKNVLQQFKTKDPNRNGKNDEVALVTHTVDPMLMGAPQGIDWRDGNTANHNMYIDNNGKIGWFFNSDAYRDSLSFMKDLYDRDLLSKAVTDGTATAANVIKSGNVGVMTVYAASLSIDDSDAFDYTVLPPIAADKNTKPTVSTNLETVQPFSMMISISAIQDQKKEAALRWIDYFYTAEGYMYINGAIEASGSKSYLVKGSDGLWKTNTKRVSGKIVKMTDSDKYTITLGWVLPSFADGEKVQALQAGTKGLTDVELQQYNLTHTWPIQTYSKYHNKYYLGVIHFTEDEAKLLEKCSGILSFGASNSKAFITGSRDLDTEWTTYLQEAKNQKAPELVATYQTAYDRMYGKKS